MVNKSINIKQKNIEFTLSLNIDFKKILMNFLLNLWFIENKAGKRAGKIVRNSKIEKYLEIDSVYLDIGTGFGHIVESILKNNLEKNIKFITSDPHIGPNKNVLKRIKQYNLDNNFIFSNINGVDFLRNQKDKSVEGVSLFFVLHHISYNTQEEIINEIRRVLKKHQFLFLVEDVPEDKESFERIENWDRRVNLESKEDQHYYRTNEDWINLLKKHGFKMVENTLFNSISNRSDEGEISHRGYVFKLK